MVGVGDLFLRDGFLLAGKGTTVVDRLKDHDVTCLLRHLVIYAQSPRAFGGASYLTGIILVVVQIAAPLAVR